MFSPKSVILIALASFCAGAALSWLFCQQHFLGNQSPARPPTYILQPPGQSAEMPPSAAQQPDLSRLSPAEAALSLGNWNYDQKNWTQAIESYQHAIALGTDNPDVQTDLGNAFRFSGDPKKALEHYQIAQRENPQHENSLSNMATLYDQVLNDPSNALRCWQDYLIRFPNGEKAAFAKQFILESGSKTSPPVQP